MRHLECAILAACLLTAPAGHASAAICPAPVAVVVANSDYGTLKLNNPSKDADVVQRALERVGYKVYRGDHLTAAQIEALIPATRSCRSDAAVLYFAGHGVQINGRAFVAGTDFKHPDGPQGPAGVAGLDDLARKLAAGADRVYLFFDASRPPTEDRPAERPNSAAALFSDIPAVKVAVFAAGAGQEPLDADPTYKELGPFARALAGSIELNWPDIDLVLLQVRQRVQRVTNGAQTPDWYRSFDAVPASQAR